MHTLLQIHKNYRKLSLQSSFVLSSQAFKLPAELSFCVALFLQTLD